MPDDEKFPFIAAVRTEMERIARIQVTGEQIQESRNKPGAWNEMATKSRPQDVAELLKAKDRFDRQNEARQEFREWRAVQGRKNWPVIPYTQAPTIVDPVEKQIVNMASRIQMDPEAFKKAVQELWRDEMRPQIEELVRQQATAMLRSLLNEEIREQIRAYVREKVQNAVKVSVTVPGGSLDPIGDGGRFYGIEEDEQ